MKGGVYRMLTEYPSYGKRALSVRGRKGYAGGGCGNDRLLGEGTGSD